MISLCFASFMAMSQGTIKGRIVDSQTKEPLVGATVMIDGTTEGIAADLDGSFVLKSSKTGKQTLVFRSVGYRELKKEVNLNKELNLGTIGLQTESIGLGDVTVTASVAVQRKTPVAIAVIEPEAIENKLSTQEFPEILKSTPGVYATKQGGGYGDSRINLRGFESENIAVMINGVPVNGMENGSVYWSNWAGLSDVTRFMQVQRGLGASKVSVPSVGGSINIVTRTTDAKEGGSISYAMGNDGYNKVSFNVSTGLKHGWAVSLLGAKTWGDGYVQGTDFEGYSYFANISKQFGDKHQLSLTVFGAPQKHYQRNRNDKLTIENWRKMKNVMGDGNQFRYNASYGFGLNGERKSASYNVYHKPQISLNHFWQINEKSSLSSVVYVSIGRGYGHSGQGMSSDYANKWYGASSGEVNTEFRNSDGTFAYDKIYKLNQESENGSLMAMGKLLNHHNWYGFLSTYSTTVAEKISLYGGVDFRYYKGVHRVELSDLFGGDFYCDTRYRSNVSVANNIAAADPNFVNEKLGVGDVVYRDYDGYVTQGGIFAQAEYNSGPLSVFVAGTLSNSSYWLRNHFYYDKTHEKSSTEAFLGWTAKGGANYNLSEHHNVFANIGYISRAPFFDGVFLQANVSTAANPDAVNEKTFSVELGYGFRSALFAANVNVYRTAWLDKTMARSEDIELADGTKDRWMINMQGVDALHQGIEFDFVLRPIDRVKLTGSFSIGDWKWDSKTTGYYYNSAGQPLKDSKGGIASAVGASDHAQAKIDLKDVPVGNSAQTTFALGASVEPLKNLHVGADYTYWGRNYSYFSVDMGSLGFGAEKKYETPWRIPSAGELDLNMNYRFKVSKLWATVYANVNNVLDNLSISDANDGVDHSWKTARVLYRFGRNYSVRLKINF